MAVDKLDTPKRPLPYSHSHTTSHSFAHALPTAGSDIRLPNASTKGKQKETEDFQFGWWDYAPLLESRRPPVQWTSSSLILTAHATEPRVACLHFPSNKHFILPDPPAISTSPSSYESPTIISASSRDNWIFAYFPGIEMDGVGCFWSKAQSIDDWSIREWQTFARGDGVVAARWLSSDREWTISDSGAPLRLPALGPFIPSLYPVLIVVTETRLCDVFYLHPQSEKVHMLSASLARRSTSKEGQKRPVGEQIDGSRGLGRCSHAAIGLGYDESSVLIAMYSYFVPSTGSESRRQSSTDMNLSLQSPPSEEHEISSSWEAWRDESAVDICEVIISSDGFFLTVATTPLPPIRDLPRSGRCLTSMTFAPSLPSSNQILPSTPTQTHRRVTPQSSPAPAPTHITQSPGRSVLRSPVKSAAPKPILEKSKGRPPGPLYLLCTTLQHGHFASAPSSEIILYVFWRNPVDLVTWSSRRMSQSPLPTGVVVHLSPFQPATTPQHTSALVAILNREGQATRRKTARHLTIGKLQILRIPELQFDDGWDPVNLVCPINSYGVELPFGFAVSPNRALVCAVPAAPLMSFNGSASAFIHQYPSRVTHGGQDLGWQRPRRQLATYAETALLRRFAPNDIIHILCTQNVPLPAIEDALTLTLAEFEASHGGMANLWMNEIIGSAVEIYRRRSLTATSDVESGDIASRFRTGVEVCSLSACIIMWENTFGFNGYDPDAIWNLTELCGYFMEDFLENMLRDCVQFASEQSMAENLGGTGEASGASTLGNFATQAGQFHSVQLRSSLLHLVHPYTLDVLHTFTRHVRRFRGFLGSKIRSEEHLQVAREILMDCVDSSPIDIEAFERVLSEIRSEVKMNAEHYPDHARRALICLKPPSQYLPLLQRIVIKLMRAQVVDKLTLFIRPFDLVDGVLGLSMNSSRKTRDRDVITKGYLTGQHQTRYCLRCGGKSEVKWRLNNTQGHSSSRWAAWERLWLTHCVCGGLWWERG